MPQNFSPSDHEGSSVAPNPAAPNLTHHFLIAMPGRDEGLFAKSVVYLCEHSAQGALGLIINKPSALHVGDLLEQFDLVPDNDHVADLPVMVGGPVQGERGFVLHEHVQAMEVQPFADADSTDTKEDAEKFPALFAASLRLSHGLEVTSSRDILEALARSSGPRQWLMTLGFSAWGQGQLENELAANAWLSVSAQSEIIFHTPIAQRYRATLALLGIHEHDLSHAAGHA